MERVRLSSRSTFLFKIVLPIVWFAMFSGGTLAALRSGGAGFAMPLLAIATAGGVFLFRTCVTLKTVTAGERGILVGNYFNESEIPYSQIAAITENRWLNPRDIIIHLNADSVFGRTIRFQPFGEPGLTSWREHPATALLRQRIEVATHTG